MQPPAPLIIAKLGGAQRVADLLGLNVSQVHRWKYPRERGGTGGFVPTRHQQELLDIAAALGVDLAPAEFFLPADPARARLPAADAAEAAGA